MDNTTEMLKGVLEGCVLEIISRGPTYGYEITLQLRSLGFVEVVEGTVYTILMRLEKSRLVETEKRPSELGPPRKYYSLNVSGYERLAAFWDNWDFVSTRINDLRR